MLQVKAGIFSIPAADERMDEMARNTNETDEARAERIAAQIRAEAATPGGFPFPSKDVALAAGDKLNKDQEPIIVESASGRTFKLRPPSPFLARQVHPNMLVQLIQATDNGDMEAVETLVERMERIVVLLVAEPKLVIVDIAAGEEVPPGCLPTYELTQTDVAAIMSAWAAPLMARQRKLQDDAGPF